MWNKYADLLVNYCLEMKKGDRLAVKSTYLAEPLLQAISEAVYKAGGQVEFIISFQEKERLFYEFAEDEQLDFVSPFVSYALENFECYLYIQSPFNLVGLQGADKAKVTRSKKAQQPTMNIYSKRTATRDLKRSLCVFPCNALAQMAGMTLSNYTDFVFEACKLFEDDPIASWQKVRKEQQVIVDYLNNTNTVKYKNDSGTDISFSTKGRTWINSDGKTNMPSGEVYTSPVENSVNGVVYFNYPSRYMSQEVKDVRLEVKDGEVVRWNAESGQNVLDEVFLLPGAKVFGEAAIGTNYSIQTPTKNTLFDEKMGGTVHLALGQSYLQTGGKNQSPVHWDLITEMRNGGEIWADEELIYQNGKFLIS